ncbi:cytochrome-c peroxidase [Neolewinella agarilytica]|uniref:Cytochrome c peroxidase n=1 Tax=Neolewinella agarilytica TaxID=478744 RepID=A0A1H9EQF9_9BACT|nr:cytochrome c peroxidase [Neolewinella agarilytica]SEQ27944.1 cytochrome c peroxidase [Neolewinella agarilytica]
MRFRKLLPLLLPFLLFTACKQDYSILQDSVPDPLENINSPLRFSDADYEELRQELDIEQDINFPLAEIPSHLASRSRTTELTATQQRRAMLGRVLFYDRRVSVTGETSCATCHAQEFAFSDNKAFSDGIRGAHTARNSFPLGSVPSFLTAPTNSSLPAVGYYSPPPPDVPEPKFGRFFWDGRAKDIVEQSRETMSNPIEMGSNLEELADKLNQERIYQILGRKAFRDEELSPGDIILAIGDFMTTMSSTDTRYDDLQDLKTNRVPMSRILEDFTLSEVRGGEIYRTSCASCHHSSMAEPTVKMANNGLDRVYTDKGSGAVTGDVLRNGFFKTPFLRNLPLTAPYMHDGRFATLREVVDHYSEGIQDHPNLSPILRNDDGSVRNLHLSEYDKQALVDFLELTKDRTIQTAEHLSDPFIR